MTEFASSVEATHVIVGAGPTGRATARLLVEAGDRVRMITRSGSGPHLAGVERVAADAADRARLGELCDDAATIFNCANPPAYGAWARDWPPLAASLLDAAESSGAGLVTVGNLYGYGMPSGPMRPTDELRASTTTGQIRARMWNDALEAHRSGQVRVTEARASDFIGAGVGKNAHMGDRIVPRLLAGKSVSVLGRVDVDHSWTAVHDVARTLVTLARDDRSWGRAWHVPTAAPMTQQAIVHRMCDLAGVPRVRITSIPDIALRAAGLFNATVRELRQVSYQFTNPFVLDCSETTEVFGLGPTPLDETLLATLAHYGLDRGPDLHVPA